MNAIWIRRLIWLYFFLLVWEGALRKWILPGWSSVLLIIRDPIVIIIYALAVNQFPWRTKLVNVILVVALLTVSTTALGFGNRFDPVVTFFGLRVNFLHMFLIFVIPCYMHRGHVVHLGKWFMIMSVPVVWLMAQQFDANIDSPWNVGVGGSIGGQLKAAVGDKARASGPFSFIMGPVLFFPLVFAFVFNALSYRKQAPKILMFLALGACLLSIPTSISRSLFLGMVVTFVFYLIGVLTTPRLTGIGIKVLVSLIFVLIALGGTRLFQESSSYLDARWQSATTESGGIMVAIVDRFLSDLRIPLAAFVDIPLFGYGLGVGTNVGSHLLTGTNTFLLAEGEWSRIMFESGPFLGIATIGLRCATVVLLFRTSWRRLRLAQDILPLSLWSACAANIMLGQWGPPTTLGFAALGGGLVLASCRKELSPVTKTSRQTPSHPVSAPRPTPTRPAPLKSNFLAVTLRSAGNGSAIFIL